MKKIGWKTATAIVISNMVGTGVFTSLGYQVPELHNTFTIILLWTIGGILALIGAFIYAELGAHFKQSGGDYIYLSRTYHPIMGYITSWVSLIVGFSGPIALAALAMAKYLGFENERSTAILIIIIIAIFQCFSLKVSSRFQNIFAVLKVAFIIVLILIGISISPSPTNALLWDNSWTHEIIVSAFASSLVFVTYAYTGWNSASYIVEEIEKPKVNLPKALIIGTVFVTVSYVLVNFVFLKHASIEQMEGKEDIANIAFTNILGVRGVKWISYLIALQLVSTISGYLWVGSRVTQATAKENHLWSYLGKENKNRIPIWAVVAHTLISILIILSGKFEEIFIYTAFVLQLLSTAAVSTSLFIKKKDRVLFKGNIFLLMPVIFLLFSFYILYFTFVNHPRESIIGLGIIGAGMTLYFFDKKRVD
ncbi:MULTISPECIES: APC family permease [unclassified Apibacter]|uniref:APC family permease n=1 Tax=unclassified Apibacter TaxID=2630820 RepID=UPI001322B3FB|nr:MULTISPECIES: amino acid permease [unclassified Apibacter]MCX8677901.1 amino acid permease [Apibacter sp. B3919]MXO25146.1 amino acid permease [Apibacter sp. B3924]MXO27349.1 amino acid permease [Apibacter sp. B3813]MXO29162.1 amino acid permease [Apibacter sp. B3913]MXO31335.1 amino acid permease [Apibacter sp. B3912]